MRLRNKSDSFGVLTKGFHWFIALSIISLLIIGFWMDGLPNGMEKLRWFGRHKAFGLTVLAVGSVWIIWRLFNVKPSYPATVTWVQRRAADTVKYMLLSLVVAMPLTGWLMSSSAGYSVSYFGLFLVPDLVEPNATLRDTMNIAHVYLAYVLIGVVCMHVGAAMLHHFYYKDNVFIRMLPFIRREKDVQETDTNTGC